MEMGLHLGKVTAGTPMGGAVEGTRLTGVLLNSTNQMNR